MGRHLTTHQAIAFCTCPMMYYLRYVEKAQPRYLPCHIFERLSIRARVAMLKKEGRCLSEVERKEDLETCYGSLFDMSVATAISNMSAMIGGIEFYDIESYLGQDMGGALARRSERAKRFIEETGSVGLELSEAAAYRPEDIDRRFVDFRYKISGNVSVLHDAFGPKMPIHLSMALPPPSGMGAPEEMVAKMNALLVEEGTGHRVMASCVFYASVDEVRPMFIAESNKDEVRSFVSFVKEKESFEKRRESCPLCPYKKECCGP